MILLACCLAGVWTSSCSKYLQETSTTYYDEETVFSTPEALESQLFGVYLGMNREARGRYQMTYTLIARDASAKTPEAVMRSYYDLLEADIRRDPANYLWTHKRWK